MTEISKEGEPLFFHVSVGRFILLSIFTLGIFEVYWFYKNWRSIRERRQNNISPVIRALFSPIWYGALINELNKEVSRAMVYNSGAGADNELSYINIWLWAPAYFILSIIVNIPGPYWPLVFFLTVGTLLPAVSVIKRLNNLAHKEVNR